MKNIVAMRHMLQGAILSLSILAQFAPAVAQNQQRVITHLTEAKDRQLWRKSIMRISPPEKGCFTVTYPSMAWQKTDCVIIPPHPVREPRQIQKKLVGDMPTNDVSALAASQGIIASSTGSFDSVMVTSETDASTNRFSLQINTNHFTTPMCSSAPAGSTNCSGWQQFVFKNDDTAKTAWIYMEYWLSGFGSPCPKGWNTFVPKVGTDSCWKNSIGKTYTPQNIQSLVNLIISGKAEANGTDTFTVTTPGDSIVALNEDSFLTLAPKWTTSEFNVFGIQDSSEAFFAPGTTLIARNSVEIAGPIPTPVPEFKSFTGESNSLTLAGPPCVIGSPFFAITYEESNIPGASRTCVTPPPPDLCQDAKEVLAFDQKALAEEQQALKTPRCEGSASLMCVQAAKAIEAKVSLDEAQVKKDCQGH